MERLNAGDFEQLRLRRDGIWVVTFVADWCPFCDRFLTGFSKLEGGPAFHTAVGDVSDESSPLWDDFAIHVVPTLVVFRDGSPVFRVDGRLGHGLPQDVLQRARAAALDSGAASERR